MCVLYIVHTIAQGAKNGKIIQYQFNKYIILMKHSVAINGAAFIIFCTFLALIILLWIDVNVEVEKREKTKETSSSFFPPSPEINVEDH